MKKETVKPGYYKHFKGEIYKVIGVGRHSETLEEMVIYIHDSKEYGKDSLWARPLSMWFERIERDGYSGSRFTPVDSVMESE
jgi:hypothetical protein